jgi:hypothetical protein
MGLNEPAAVLVASFQELSEFVESVDRPIRGVRRMRTAQL